MISKKIFASSLSTENTHLQDIMTDNCYIEIGNINLKVFSSLLDGKLISLNELSDYRLQDIGLGKSEIEVNKEVNQEVTGLREILPYVRLLNKLQNHPSTICAITYGVLVQKVNRKNYSSHEEFIPMVIIPVQLYYTDGFYFQLLSQPFPNNNISNAGRKSNAHQGLNESLNNLNQIDEFCLSYNELGNVRLESYVTFIRLKNTNTTFRNKYQNMPLNLYSIENNYNVENNSMYNFTRLNKVQRIALEKSHYGHSFELIGVEGTGKTTALANIAINACYNKKRVLYLSSTKETLNQVYDLFMQNDLNSVVSPLYLPFPSLKERYVNNSTKVDYKTALTENKKLREELKQKYKHQEAYISLMYKRINNYYVIDILDSMIHYKDLKTNFDEETLKGISHIYKEEIPEIEDALNIVDQNINKITSTCHSDFSPIPSYVHASKKEVLEVLDDLSRKYKELESIIDNLNKAYGCVQAENYAFIRSFLNNYHILDTLLVPRIWLNYNDKELYEFEKAKKVFKLFDEEMAQLNIKNQTLNEHYYMSLVKEMDVEKDASFIFDRFRNGDKKTIDHFLKDNHKIIDELESFIPLIKKGEEDFASMNHILKNNIEVTNDTLIDSIISFMMFAHKNPYASSWFETEKKDAIREELAKVKEELDIYEDEKLELGIKDTKRLSDYIDSLRFKSFIHFKDKKRKTYLEKAIKLFEKTKTIDAVFSRYQELSGTDYVYNDNILKTFDRFMSLYLAIDDEKVRTGLAKCLSNKDKEALELSLKPFIDYSDYYIQANKIHRLLLSYFLVTNQELFVHKIDDIVEAYTYALKVKEIQTSLNKCMKDGKYHILVEDIDTLRNRLKERNEIEESIDSNKEYKRLLSELFIGHNSDVYKIKILIDDFNIYIKDFTSYKAATQSIIHPYPLSNIIDKTGQLCEEIIESIKNYSKYFKDSVEAFYYSKLDSVYKRMDTFLSKEEELGIYLNINSAVDKLNYYGLNNLSKYIYDDGDKTILYHDTFMKNYFTHLFKTYEKTIPSQSNEYFIEKGNFDLLESILYLENKLIESNKEVIKNSFKNRFVINHLSNLDYEDYLERTEGIKYIFLATPIELNYRLDITNYDLVIVDDAHLLDGTEAINLSLAKQLIVAGSPETNLSITDDILSSMKRVSTVKFNYRYLPSPLALINNNKEVKGDILPSYRDNQGVNYSKLSIYKIFGEILSDKENKVKDLKINIFLENEYLIQETLDKITTLMIHKAIPEEDIKFFLIHGLFIGSLKRNYGLKANYNILYLKDYEDENEPYEIRNYLLLLTLVSEKLVICDEQNSLDKLYKNKTNSTNDKGSATSSIEVEEEKNDLSKEELEKIKELEKLTGKNYQNLFLNRIRGLVNTPIRFPKLSADGVVEKVQEAFERYQIKVLGKAGNYHLILKYGDSLYGVAIWDINSLHYSNVLNTYRNNQYSCNLPTSYFYLFDLVDHFDDCINQMLTKMGIPIDTIDDNMNRLEKNS